MNDSPARQGGVAKLVAIAILALACVPRAAALDFPADAPAFAIAVPEGWASEVTKGSLRLYPEDEGLVILIKKAAAGDVEEVATAVVKKAMRTLTGPRMIRPISETQLDPSLKGFGTEIAGKDDEGNEVHITVLVVPLGEEKLRAHGDRYGEGRAHAQRKDDGSGHLPPGEVKICRARGNTLLLTQKHVKTTTCALNSAR